MTSQGSLEGDSVKEVFSKAFWEANTHVSLTSIGIT